MLRKMTVVMLAALLIVLFFTTAVLAAQPAEIPGISVAETASGRTHSRGSGTGGFSTFGYSIGRPSIL